MEDFPLDCSGNDLGASAAQASAAPSPHRRGHVPKPPGSYQYYKKFVEEAVATDAAPSPDLIEANKRLAWWEAYLGIGEVSSFPVVLHLAITDVCNARCLFCSYAPENSANRGLKLSDIARADWLKFVELFFPNSGLGEPLVHPQIAAILNEVRRHAPFIKMGITTNAALLNDAVIAAVVGHLSIMVVSLNAARKETYEHVMAPLKWETTLDNIRRLTAYKKAQGTSKPEIQASIVVHRYNIEELPEVPALLQSLGVDRMRVLVMSIPRPVASRKLYGRDDLIHHEPRKANQAFEMLREQCKLHGVSLVHPLPVLAER